MRRREFITLLGGAAVAGPITARAQQPAMPVVGFVRSESLADATSLVTAFREGLKEAGFVEGQNVAVEYRSGEGQPERLQSVVSELLHRPVAVIAGNSVAMLAAKAATTTIPIVFASGGDPVQAGLVASLNRPGGNVTGVVFISGALGAKRLELLRQLAPKATAMAMLVKPNAAEAEDERRDVQAAAQAVGQQLIVIDVNSDSDLDIAFASFAQRGVGALLVGSGGFMTARRQRLVQLAARYALPAGYDLREFATAGGLMSYGTSITDAFRQTGVYTGRILKGEKPADLPVMQSTKFELVLNLKTAKTLGISVPPNLLAIADEVIE
jgi:putative tryptophan/tyrosine transport system substrate-binding protein